MANLVLIRHSESKVEVATPAATWGLTSEGRRRCADLANELRRFRLYEIVASVEPKASETAELVAAGLGIGWRTAPGLHEHAREVMPWMDDAAWQAQIRRFFEHPDELVFGLETAKEALDRFRAAVQQVIDVSREGDVAIATHGTVMSLYIGDVLGSDPYTIWRQLEMPDYRVLPLNG